MSNAHYDEETGLFHEEHFRNELAKASAKAGREYRPHCYSNGAPSYI